MANRTAGFQLEEWSISGNDSHVQLFQGLLCGKDIKDFMNIPQC